MHRVASSTRGPTSAWVGHASRQRVHVPQRSASNGESGSSSRSTSSDPMKKKDPISGLMRFVFLPNQPSPALRARSRSRIRSEEHTSELQSQSNLVCRLLLEKKKKNSYLIEFMAVITL